MRRSSLAAGFAFIGLTGVTSLRAQSPDTFFVRKEVNLRSGPSTAANSLGLLRPGAIVTVSGTPSSGFVQVKTKDRREGWVSEPNIRPLAALELEEAARPVADIHVARDGSVTGVLAARAPQVACPSSFAQCPITGCGGIDANHKRANRRKRSMPDESSPARHLRFADFSTLQEETDHRGVPQGEVLTAPERSKLKNIPVNGVDVSEGDFVAISGFIAKDRTIRCGGAESVNCRFTNSANEPCTRTDIHLPVVEAAEGIQVESVVVEPIPQNPNHAIWTPTILTDLKDDRKKLLILGGLFYDSQHIVNTDDDSQGGQPKRFTVWEVHPVTHVLVCSRPDNSCDPELPNDGWQPIG